MSKLTKLYDIISNAAELGIELGDDVYRQTNKLEENIIKKEILPIIREKVEPTLRQIKHEITLVVDYVPNGSIKVRMSRELDVYKKDDFIDLTPDPEVEHIARSGSKIIKRKKNSSIRIIRRDGSILQKSTAGSTLVEAIKEANPLKVRGLRIVCCKVPLVSTSLDKKYSPKQVLVGKNLYVITHSNNEMKVGYLRKISKSLELGWKVELLK